VYREIWAENIRALLAEHDLSIAEAARLVGTSKQYLSAILAETEPPSMREQIIDRLSLLLHANPARLYTPLVASRPSLSNVRASSAPESERSLTPAEQAILAERNFLACEYQTSYFWAKCLLDRHSVELSPRAIAQAELLAGKCACLLGQSADASVHLRRALAFWRKRINAQPAKYLSVCLDTYRYLALSAHLAGDYPRVLELNEKALGLYSRFPDAAYDLKTKWENIALNMSRAAARVSLQAVGATADFLRAFCAAARLPALAERTEYELVFCRYALSRVGVVGDTHGQASTLVLAHAEELCVPPQHTRDPLVGLGYGLALWERGDVDALAAYAASWAVDQPNIDQGFVGAWLANMTAPAASHVPLLEVASGVSAGLAALLRACQASLEGDDLLTLHVWQNALYELRAVREYPLYFLAYAGGLKRFQLPPSYREEMQASLKRSAGAYAR